ncbi:MAG: caspase family protein [Saprospiraceae bacterium]
MINNKQFIALLPALFLCVVTGMQAQSLSGQPLREQLTGGGGEEKITSLSENWQGMLAATGTASKGDNGGSDIFLLLMDKKLNKQSERHIGRSGDDGANYIGQTLDGRWLVAGYAEMPRKKGRFRERYFGKRDGWILLLDESGRTEKEFIFGGPDQDEFTGAFPMPDGSFVLTGTTSAAAWWLHVSAEGNVIQEKKLRYHDLPTYVLSAAMAGDGTMMVTGYVEENDDQRMWLAGLGGEGELVFEKIFPLFQAARGNSIVRLDENTMAIAGYVMDKKLRGNGFFCTVSLRGELLAYQSLGGREEDFLSAIQPLQDGRIGLVGRSKSFLRGSRRDRAWVVITDRQGNLLEERYYGSKANDEALSLLQQQDGSLFSAGFSSQNVLKSEQAWIFQLSSSTNSRPPEQPLSLKSGAVHYPNGTFIEPDGRAFLNLEINNEGKGLSGLRAVMELESDFSENNNISHEVMLPVLLPNIKQALGLPLFFRENVERGAQRFKVQVYQGTRLVSDAITFVANIGENTSPKMEMSLLPQPSANQLGVEVRNTGNGRAQGVSLFVSSDLSGAFPDQEYIGEIPAGETRRKVFQIKPIGVNENLTIRAVDATLQFTDTLIIKPQLQEAVAINPDTTGKRDYLTAIWLSPNPDQFDRKEIVWPEGEIIIQIKVISNKGIDKQHFCIEINGQPCVQGAKFEEVEMKGSRFSRTFQQRIKLGEGLNSLRARVRNEAGQVETEPLKIVYAPRKPNLHILAIGVPAIDLKYTTKDARDFVQALTAGKSTNQAFQAVFLDTLFTEETTTKTEILKTLRRMQYRFDDRQIAPQDLLLVFISSHGLSLGEGAFRIAASDFDGPFVEETSLDFEKEIVNYLRPTGCRQLFILDACHSGTADQPHKKSGMAEWAANQQRLNMLVSCRAEEYSYEDDQWENGAFTEGLVQAFQTFFKGPGSLDLNADHKLDLSELFGFVSKRVPELVQTKRPKPTTSQQPMMILSDPDNPLILFGSEKK